MKEYRRSSHTISWLTVHLIFVSKQLKGRSSKKLQDEYPILKKRYWGQRFWSRGYGAFSTGNITDEMVQDYIEKHRKDPNDKTDNFFLE